MERGVQLTERAVPEGMAAITVRVPDAHPSASVAWLGHDYRSMGYLEHDGAAPPGTFRGIAPPGKVELYALDLEYVHGDPGHAVAARAHEARATANLTAGAAEVALTDFRELSVAVRRVQALDRHGVAVRPMVGAVVLDGSFEAVRSAVLNPQRFATDEAGWFRVVTAADEVVAADLTIPLLASPVRLTLAPGALQTTLRDLSLVLCSVVGGDGASASYAHVSARAHASARADLAFEQAPSDVRTSAPFTLAWAHGTEIISVRVDGAPATLLRSPSDPCVVQAAP
jgi:hypothetical protein